MNILGHVAVRVTRTPLDGSPGEVYQQDRYSTMRRILACSFHPTQSIGDQEGRLVLDDTGQAFRSWVPGDVLRIDVKRPRDAEWIRLGEGFLLEASRPLSQAPTLNVTIAGYNAVLDRIQIEEEVAWRGLPLTDLYEGLCDDYLPGYVQDIESDAAIGDLVISAGMKLREALDLIRRSLIAATGDKWEHVADHDSDPTIRLYTRDSTVQATYRVRDALPGTEAVGGSIHDVVNRAIVTGAVRPSQVASSLNATPNVDPAQQLASTSKRIVQDFVALDTPLSKVSVYLDRSSGIDPPALNVHVARLSDNLSLITEATGRRYDTVETRRYAGLTGTLASLWDYDPNAGGIGNTGVIPTDGTYYEYVAWDLGSATECQHIFAAWSGSNVGCKWKLQGSNDDSAWNDVCAEVGSVGTAQRPAVTDTAAYRYWRILVRKTGAVTATLYELRLSEYKNLATDPANPHLVLERNNPGAIATTGAMTKEWARFDFGVAKPIIKFIVSHSHGSANASITVRVQRSDDGSNWSDMMITSTSTSTVVDNVYLDGIADFRYMRFVVQDDRAGGSASISHNMQYCEVYLHGGSMPNGDGDFTPLAGDVMRGSNWSWSVANLVKHPGVVEAHGFPSPRLALITGRRYGLVFGAPSASATSWWQLYATVMDPGYQAGYYESAGLGAHRISTDSGATWGVPSLDRLRVRLEFNEHQLTSQRDDAASQTKYAGLVPGGILAGGHHDEALVTQDMVDREAEALLTARADIRPRIRLVVGLDPRIQPGRPVSLAQDFLHRIGYAGTFDVLAATHDLADGGRSTLTLNDHVPEDALGVVASFASRRTL